MTPWNYAGPLRTWPAGSWNMATPTHVRFPNKAAGDRSAAAYRKQFGLGLDGQPRRYRKANPERTKRYLRNQGKRSDKLLRSQP